MHLCFPKDGNLAKHSDNIFKILQGESFFKILVKGFLNKMKISDADGCVKSGAVLSGGVTSDHQGKGVHVLGCLMDSFVLGFLL